MSTPRGKRWLFTAIATVLAVCVSVGALTLADVYLHRRFATSAGLNVWGYRGPVAGRKQAGERRLVLLGGSTAFGYGVHWQEAMPAVLENLLNGSGAATPKVSVVNLGYNNQGAHSFAPALEDYAYLEYDAAIFYTGYNDLAGLNTAYFRRESAVFRLTGYLPILPLVVREKAMALRHGGDLDAAYRNAKVTFTPTAGQRTAASALEAVANVGDSLERQLNRALADPRMMSAHPEAAECGRWSYYCGEVYAATKYALDRQKHVLIVGQPSLPGDHLDQQAHLVAFLQHRFPGHPLLHFADLGHAVNLADPASCFDGLHLTAAGNRLLAQQLAPAVSDMVRSL